MCCNEGIARMQLYLLSVVCGRWYIIVERTTVKLKTIQSISDIFSQRKYMLQTMLPNLFAERNSAKVKLL